MEKSIFSILKERSCLLSILFLISYILCYPAFAESDKKESEKSDLFQLISPKEGAEVISKKPVIKCAAKQPFKSGDLLVLLDGTDVTEILKMTPEGFEYTPLQVLSSGEHTLSITLKTKEGKEEKKEFKFSTRHSKTVEEFYTKNEITTLYEKAVKKREADPEDKNLNSWKLESNLSSESKIKFKKWELSFNTNLKYFDQHLPVESPVEKGLSLSNFLLKGKYNGEKFTFSSELGDVTIDETENTVKGLARRGGKWVFESKDLHLTLSAFSVKGDEVIGFKGGMGIGTNTNDHIMGASGEVSLFSDKVKFKTVYAKGGMEGTSSVNSSSGTSTTESEEKTPLGTSSTDSKQKGEVLGFNFKTDFLKGKLATEAELDFSKFDADNTDNSPAERDKAYRLKASGKWGKFNYEGFYEYFGPNYEVIGNQGLDKDKEGFTLKAGADFEKHVLNLSLSRYNDNVEKDREYCRVYTHKGEIEYKFNQFKELPIVLNYQRSQEKSAMEPSDTSPTKKDTDTLTGKINYIKGKLDIGLQTVYSFQNDRTSENDDTTAVTYTFTPKYTLDPFSITPSLSFNRSRAHLTSVNTDTYTTTLDLSGKLFKKRLSYEFAGTYTLLRASDDSTKEDTLNTSFKVSYLLFKDLWGFLNPSVGFRGLYNRTNDRVANEITREFGLYLFLSTSMLFTF